MKIGLLMAGESAGGLAEKYGAHEQQFIDLFEPLHDTDSPNIEWKIYYVLNDIFPQSADECDAYLVTGSKHGVYDNLPWMIKLSEFIRQIISAKKRLTGVCFGHQIIADALGGDVGKSDKGWGLGRHAYQIEAIHPSLEGLSSTIHIAASHQDQVTTPPVGARVFQHSDFCDYAGLIYPGDRIMTLQPHPEFDVAFSKALIEQRRGDPLGNDEADVMLRAMDEPLDNDGVARVFADFLKKCR